MRRRLRWRWLRAKALRLVRRHYMVSFTAVALIVAAAGALGYFDDDGSSEPPRQAAAPTPTPFPTVSLTPDAFFPVEPLTVTYYLVDNEDDVAALQDLEDRMIFREILEKDAIEVLLIRNDEEEAEAFRVLEEAQTLAEESGFILVVQDLRD
jgi:hypothetical protein